MSELRTKYSNLERLTTLALIVIAGTVLYLRRKPIMIPQGQSLEFPHKGYGS
ncbi:MAG: hypothetical protein WCF14_00235 [Nitrososphaeraceae archaeon]